jgi:hypothetical protein
MLRASSRLRRTPRVAISRIFMFSFTVCTPDDPKRRWFRLFRSTLAALVLKRSYRALRPVLLNGSAGKKQSRSAEGILF